MFKIMMFRNDKLHASIDVEGDTLSACLLAWRSLAERCLSGKDWSIEVVEVDGNHHHDVTGEFYAAVREIKS